jgi:hypothetical protein
LRREAGLFPATLFLLLNAFPPPFFEWSIHCAFWGNHFESYLFSGALLFVLFRRRDRPPGLLAAAAAGLIAWFAIFYCTQNTAIVATLVVVVLWRWRGRNRWRILLPAAVAFGLCPFKLSQLRNSLAAVTHAGGHGVAAKARDLFFVDLPQSAGYGKASFLQTASWIDHFGLSFSFLSTAPLISYYFFALFATALFCLATKRLRPAWLPALYENDPYLGGALGLFFGVWVAAFLASQYQIERPPNFLSYRYLLPIYPAIMALICIFLDYFKTWQRWVIAAPLLAAGFVNVAATLIAWTPSIAHDLRALVRLRGDDYLYFIDNYYPETHYSNDAMAAARANADRFPRRWRGFAWETLARKADPEQMIDILLAPTGSPAWRRRSVAFGLGARLGENIGKQIRTMIVDRAEETQAAVEFPAAVSTIAVEAAEEMVAGIGLGLANAPFAERGDNLETAEILASKEADRPSVEKHIASRMLVVQPLFPQIPKEEFTRRVLFGVAYRAGRRSEGNVDLDFQRFWASALGFAAAEAEREIARGFYDGRADFVTTRCRRFDFTGEPADLQILRQALERRGVILRPSTPQTPTFTLDLAPD